MRRTMRRTTATMGTTKRVTLQEVIDTKACARHERSPWRVDMTAREGRQFLKGRPEFDNGSPVYDGDEMAMLWTPASAESIAHWEQTGWILEKSKSSS